MALYVFSETPVEDGSFHIGIEAEDEDGAAWRAGETLGRLLSRASDGSKQWTDGFRRYRCFNLGTDGEQYKEFCRTIGVRP